MVTFAEVDEKSRILERADRLLGEGQDVLATKTHSDGLDFVDDNRLREWALKVQTLVRKVEPDNGHYLRSLTEDDFGHFGTNYNQTMAYVAALRAFRDDIEHDMFVRAEDLVAADVFEDLLSQAEHLLSASYLQPAASLAGAVLERELRVLAARRGLRKKDDALASLNRKLVSARAYNAVKSKKIEAWTKIRNFADHGEFDKLDAAEVEEMINGVRDFLDSMLTP